MIKKVIFWGTGNMGKLMLLFWKVQGYSPDFFCSNDETMWGKEIDGVPIIAPEEIKQYNKVDIYITCYAIKEIKRQLFQMGVSSENIVMAANMYSRDLIFHIADELYKNYEITEKNRTQGCYIDLNCGMVLGGVERWCYTIADDFQKNGINGAYIVPDMRPMKIVNATYNMIRPSEKAEKCLINECMKIFLRGEFSTIICNFPFEIFVAACLAKRKCGNKIKLIAVIHNDEKIYYDVYCKFEEEIDLCLVISNKIMRTMIDKGFPREKLQMLYWNIPLEKVSNRCYSSANAPIRLGYAGRITLLQKRIDLLLELAIKLKQRKINFRLDIAGRGDYEEELKIQIDNNDLAENVRLLGYVEHGEIYDFWKKQDICISCSDYEGHSISQSEAMACGAVPVIMNTSGAEDDVKQGINGFIVESGNVDSMVDVIEEISEKRHLLKKMGDECINIINRRNEQMAFSEYWEPLLEV